MLDGLNLCESCKAIYDQNPGLNQQLWTEHLQAVGAVSGDESQQVDTSPNAVEQLALPTAVGDTPYPTEAVISEMVAPVLHETSNTLMVISSIQIANQAMFDEISRVLQRKSVTQPLLQAKERVDDWFRPAKDRLSECETRIKTMMSEYLLAQESARLQQIASGQPEAIEPATQTIDGTSSVETWDFTIEDELLIPRYFLIPDMRKIGSHIKAHKDQSAIPGVKVHRSFQIRSSKYKAQ
jgi:hypothetical protein